MRAELPPAGLAVVLEALQGEMCSRRCWEEEGGGLALLVSLLGRVSRTCWREGMWLLWNMATGRQGEMGQWVLGLGWVQLYKQGLGVRALPCSGGMCILSSEVGWHSVGDT